MTLVELVTDSPPLQFIMASRNMSRVPLLLSSCKNYEDWCKMVRAWTKFTNLAPERQEASMFLSLEGEALDAVPELFKDEISSKDAVKIIITSLDKLYKKR